MKNKRLVPELRFYEFEGEWKKNKLSERMDVFRGASPRPKGDPRYYGGTIPRLMIEDVTRDGKYAFPKIDFLTEEGAKKSRFLKKGSVVLSCSGTRVAIPGVLGVDACIHDGWLGFKNLKKIDSDFLYNLFVKLHEKMQGEATTGGVFNNLTTTIVKDLKFGFPPSLMEQKKIATFLTSIDQHIQLLEKKKAKLEAYKKGVMQQIFSQEVRFKIENEVGELVEPSDWEEKKLGDVCEKKSSNISANSLPENSGNFKIYGATGFLRYVDFFREESPYISIVKDGAGVGRILLCEAKSSVLGTLDILKPKGDNDINFLYSLLSNIRFDKYVTGSTIPHIYFKDYSKEKMLVPSLPEQQKIATFLSSIDKNIAQITQQIEKSKSFKKGLLQKMFV